ncbi:hypothetical protein [Pseudomonas maioricensis]|uniref:hypothetical protein n=1 Tax=Pseudomonas maioricensis TaxID=1766623 RepID=UPI001FAB9AA9|nr:hypothetical protein [Pseudomonas sp. S25]
MNIDFWPRWIAAIFLMTPYLLMTFGWLVAQYIGVRHLDAILDALKNSDKYRWSRGSTDSMGWRERRWEAARISFEILWPGAAIRAGRLDADDIENFPAHLRLLLQISARTSLIGLDWALVSSLMLKLR